MGITCDQCGFGYVPAYQSNRRAHRRYHDEFVDGIKWKPSGSEQVIYDKDDFRITLVSPASPLFLRRRARKVGSRGNTETNYDFGVYDEDGDCHALIGHIGDRAVALLILQRMSCIWRANWTDRDKKIEPELISDNANHWGSGFSWVLPKYRRTGVATLLRNIAARWAGVPREELSWMPPLTESGEQFARNYCPDNFLLGKP